MSGRRGIGEFLALRRNTGLLLVALVLAGTGERLWLGFAPKYLQTLGASIATNLLNPHPWLFWLTVGAAILARALAQSRLVALSFLVGFYLLLIGSKVTVALLVGRYRDLLAGQSYRVAPMKKVAETVQKHLDGILAHWTTGWLSTGFLEGLNSVFSAVKRKARGFRSSVYMITMLYFGAGKLSIPHLVSH